MPRLGVAETNARPTGSGSETVTPVAVLGPSFATPIVNVTVEPTRATGWSTDFVTTRSTCCETSALAVSLSGLGSYGSPLMLTVLVIVPGSPTVAVRCNVADAPESRSPIVQMPVSGS